MKISITATTENLEKLESLKRLLITKGYNFSKTTVGQPYPKPKTYKIVIRASSNNRNYLMDMLYATGMDVIKVKTIEVADSDAIETFHSGKDSSVRVYLDFAADLQPLYPNGYLEINEEDTQRFEQAWLERRRIKLINSLRTDKAIQYFDLSAVICMKFIPWSREDESAK